MFSGLIAYHGVVISNEIGVTGGTTLVLRCDGVAKERPEIKDSIATDGVCLTATAIDGEVIAFDVVPETLMRSSLVDRHVGDVVNIEYSLRVGDRMGGHFVYGHVDATARVIARTPEGQGERVRIERAPALAPMIVEKAFVAIDGVSLTVTSVGDEWFELALIPETLKRTTLGARPVDSLVNVEVDPIARYAYAAVEAICQS